MKRLNVIGVCLLALWLCVASVCPVSADTPADAARTMTWNGAAMTSEDETAAFWEYPQLTAGQSRRDGGLTFINQSFGTVTVDVTDLKLPYDDADALTYLGALRLTVRDGDRVLYDGAFSRLSDVGLTAPVTLKGGETRRLSIDLSCDFAYTGAASCGGKVIYWNFTATSAWYQPVLDTWMYWAPALFVIILLIVFLRLRRRRPAPVPAQPEPADEPDLPPDLPKPEARGPVTLQIDDLPKRRKAAHAAPRHAKKK